MIYAVGPLKGRENMEGNESEKNTLTNFTVQPNPGYDCYG